MNNATSDFVYDVWAPCIANTYTSQKALFDSDGYMILQQVYLLATQPLK
jgi:hypothetical protein